jgi:hypothetical protein
MELGSSFSIVYFVLVVSLLNSVTDYLMTPI